MFARFARFISRHWILVLIAWIVLAVGFRLAAPRWDEVTQDGDFAYLPKRLASVRGDELMAEDFPELTSKSSVVLVVARPNGRLTEADVAVVARLAEMFQPAKGEKSPVHEIMSYRPDDVVGRKLISRYDPKKGQAALVILQLTSEVLAIDNMPFINQVYAKVKDLEKEPSFPKRLEVGVTGTAPVGTDLLESMRESIENTEWTTIVLVIAILLIVYRAGAGAGAAGVDRGLLLRLAQSDRPGGAVVRTAPLRLPDFQDDADFHHRDPVRRGDGLLPVPDRPLPRGA